MLYVTNQGYNLSHYASSEGMSLRNSGDTHIRLSDQFLITDFFSWTRSRHPPFDKNGARYKEPFLMKRGHNYLDLLAYDDLFYYFLTEI